MTMKPNDPDANDLDELAAELDAGWDTAGDVPGVAAGSSSAPPSTDALDADWDVEPVKLPQRAAAQPRAQPARSSSAQASQARPGSAPLLVSKQERRGAERRRRAHQAQQKVLSKKQRKAERLAQAQRESEQARAAAEQAQAARQAKAGSARKMPRQSRATSAPSLSRVPSAKRVTKQVRREERVRPAPRVVAAKSAPPPVIMDRGAKKLIPLIAIAVAFGVTLCFALLRARAH
jgi:hypothetical protein